MEISIIIEKLSEHIKWNKARLNFLANFLIALIKLRTVNLPRLANVFQNLSKSLSSYRRIQRFLSNFDINYSQIAKLVVSMLGIYGLKWNITFDRTNWKFGQTHINILMLGVVYKGICFPLLWTVLSKAGNSNLQERSELLDRFCSIFGPAKIDFFLADREFVAENWFAYLQHHHNINISFRIRIRGNTLISNSRGESVQAHTLFRHLHFGESAILSQRRRVLGQYVFVIGMALKDEYLIICTDRNPESALADYRARWQTESLFGVLKTRGFCLEDTHITQPDRIERLLALLSIAVCWAHIVGEFSNSAHPILVKKHGRKASSLFRYGLDLLQFFLSKITFFWNNFISAVSLLFYYSYRV
jgi:hypothetical protein